MRFFLILLALIALTACKAEDSSSIEETTEPKTHYGKSVERADDLAADADMRNEDINQQAEQLFNDDL